MEILQQISAVAFVFLLLGGVVWALRKSRSSAALRMPWTGSRVSRTGRQLELLDRLPLTPQHSLHFVRVAEATYLVATHTAGATLMPISATGDFHSAFSTAVARQDPPGAAPCA